MSIPGAASPLFLATTAGAADAFEISRSLRFNSGDSAYLNRTPSSAGNRKKFTYSAWVKRSKISTTQNLFGIVNAATQERFQFGSNNQIYFVYSQGTLNLTAAAVFIDFSSWYHIVLAVDTDDGTASDRVKLYVNGARQTLSGTNPSSGQQFDFNNTVQHRIGSFNDGGNNYHYADYYMAEATVVDGSQLEPTSFGAFDDNGVWQAIDTDGLTFGTNGFRLKFADNSSDAALGTDSSGNSNTWTVNNITANAVDYAATGTVSSTTGSNFGPGTIANLFDNDLNPSGSGYVSAYSSGTHDVTITFSPKLPDGTTIELFGWKGTSASSGVVEVNGTDVSSAISAQYNSPPAWGDVSSAASGGIQTITLYRQNGVKNPAIAGIRVDGVVLVSGTPSNTDSLVDTPSNGNTASDTGLGGQIPGNYCTWNPLTPQWANVTYGSGWGTLSNGNLNITASGLSQAGRINGTFGMSAGKWYWESTITSTDGMAIGIAAYDSVPSPNGWTGTDSKSYAYSSSGVKNNNNSPSSYGASFTTNDVIGVAFDADNGTLTFYKNGSSQGTAFTGLTNGPYVPSEGYANRTTVANFGQRQYTHSAPSGYKSLNTANLPTPTIADGSQYFDTKLYSGNGGTQALTMDNSSMSPGFVWIKRRDGSAWHFLFDTVRGSNKALFSNDTAAESNYGSNYLDAFTSNGFTLGSNADVNGSSRTFAAWTWAGGTSTVTNNDGSIASQVRANPSAGFSIATFTGTGSSATIGHGLNAEPHLLLTKCRESGFNWAVYHKSLGNTGRLMLNNTLAFDTGSGAGMWNNTTPTNSVFSVGSFFASGNTFVAYCFSSVSGYSAMGSYVGNGNADGVFVYLGFRPKFIIFKISSGSEDWMIFDTARDTYNLTDQELYANLSKAEEDNDRGVDILSNGFKTRTTSSKFNGSGSTYVYLAFAENPFKTARAR